MIDVGNHASNLWLNLCLGLITLAALAAIVPWGALGVRRMAELLRWIWLPVAVLAVSYEALMPSSYDIRIDLLILLPLYLLVLVTCLYRWWRLRRVAD